VVVGEPRLTAPDPELSISSGRRAVAVKLRSMVAAVCGVRDVALNVFGRGCGSNRSLSTSGSLVPQP